MTSLRLSTVLEEAHLRTVDLDLPEVSAIPFCTTVESRRCAFFPVPRPDEGGDEQVGRSNRRERRGVAMVPDA